MLHFLADRVGEAVQRAAEQRRFGLADEAQVTASSSPRAAAARRTRRSIICERVAVGLGDAFASRTGRSMGWRHSR